MSIDCTKNSGIGRAVMEFVARFMIMHLTLRGMVTPSTAFQLFPTSLQLNRYYTSSCFEKKSLHHGSISTLKFAGLFITRENSGPDDVPHPNDIDDNDDQEDQWRNLLDGIHQPLNAKKNLQNTRVDPLMGYTYEDLNRYAETASSSGRKLSIDNFPRPTMDDDIGMDSDAIFLEPEAYLQLSCDSFHMNEPVSDGSDSYHDPYNIRFREPMQEYLEAISFMPSDNSISASKMDSTNDSSTIDDLWSMIGALQLRQNNSSIDDLSQDLHHQIFQNEGGFYNQSSVFLESLTNTSKATEANIERRGRNFRNRQQEAIAALNQQIVEMESLLLKQMKKPCSKRQRCCQCNSFLSDEELRKGDASIEATANAICRVCYMEELLTKSKRLDMERLSKRQPRARTALQPYRRSGNLSKNSKEVAFMRTYQNVSHGGNRDLHDRSSVDSDLQQLRSELASSQSINTSTLQNTTVDHIPVAETTMMSVSIHPWVEMIDPDTNEIFYWNEETEEMRLEL
jgi:hypothetical protein